MLKVDLKKDLKDLYNPSATTFSIVNVPAFNYLFIDGQGDPNTSQQYKDAVEALFSVSYGLKFDIKKGQGLDYAVMPLEGLWWSDDDASYGDKSMWQWSSMVLQPDYITQDQVEKIVAEIKKKKGIQALGKIRFEKYEEGMAVQIMYIGSFSDEHPTIERMHNFINGNNYSLAGKHHEIYLSDQRRTKPDKLKTILRQPIK